MKIYVLVIVIFLLSGYYVSGQEGEEFRFTLKTNPLSAMGGPLFVTIIPITGEYKVLFEAKTTKRQSIEMGVGYLGPSLLLNLDELSESDSVSGVHTSGFRTQIMYKFFLTKESAPEGFYVGPHFSYAKATIKNRNNTEDKFSASKLNMNVVFGYQMITGGGFALNIYTGLGYKLRDIDFAEDTDFDFDYGNEASPNVAFGLTFGYAF